MYPLIRVGMKPASPVGATRLRPFPGALEVFVCKGVREISSGHERHPEGGSFSSEHVACVAPHRKNLSVAPLIWRQRGP